MLHLNTHLHALLCALLCVVLLVLGLALLNGCAPAPLDPADFPRARVVNGPANFAAVEWNDSLQWDIVATPRAENQLIQRFRIESWNPATQSWQLSEEATAAAANFFVYQQRSTVPDGSDTLGWRYIAFDGLGFASEPVIVWVVAGQRLPRVELLFPGLTANEVQAGSAFSVALTAEAGTTGSDLSRLRIESDTAFTDTTWQLFAELVVAGRSGTLQVDTLAPERVGRMRWRAIATDTDAQEVADVQELEILPR